MLFYLLSTICQSAQTSLPPAHHFLLSESRGHSRYVFFEGTANVVWHDRTISRLCEPCRRQETPVSERISLPHCSEDAGFVWSSLAVLLKVCASQGLCFSLHVGLLSTWPQFCCLHWYAQGPGSKRLSGSSLELKTGLWMNLYIVPVEGPQPSPSIRFCLSSMGAFLPLKDAARELQDLVNTELCEPALLPAVNRKIGRHQVNLIILPQFF